MAGVNFDNPASYKSCSKKMYDIHVCMPPKDTVVINSLEQADVVKMLNGKTYFTVAELEHMQKIGDERFNMISQAVNSGRAYLVSDKTPFVLAGTCGEMWCISPDKLASAYNFVSGNGVEPINDQTLKKRTKANYDGLDWTVVRTKSVAGKAMACFVPTSQKGQIQTSWGAVRNINGAGVKHGKGDFVLCSMLPNGKPNLADRWVVNGEIFATTYNNQGWTNCLSSSSVRSITIDSLPKLVSQQAVNNDKGVDANVFKQKCDTLMKELQKVYKFNIASNEYGTVDNCIGFSKSKCYTARYIVKGNFHYKYGSLDEPSSSTLIWFVCDATHSDSALVMVFERDETVNTQCKDITTKGTVSIELPHNNTGVNTTYVYKNCRTGSISDINCAEEVQSFKQRHKGTTDTFIDNRKSSSNNDIDVYDFLTNIQRSDVQGSIGIEHILEEVYNGLTTDNLKERAHLCHKIYAGTRTGYGSMSLHYASYIEANNKGAVIGNGVLSHKMNLQSLIKYLVSVCQHDEENSYNAKLILVNLSRTAVAEAVMKLFYDHNNPSLSVLWKRLDLQYMLKGDIKLYFQKGYDNVNDDRVCIDFNINSFKDGVFVRCVYTKAGNYGFRFLPKRPIEESGVGATYSFDQDFANYLEICKQLRDSCYMCLLDWANKPKAFIKTLPECLIETDFEYLGLLGGNVDVFFRMISNNQDAHKSDYNRENNTYNIKFAVGNETRVLYMREDDAHTVSVKCTLNGITFEKSYKLSIKRNISITAMLIFSDICKVLKIHPAKELLKSKRLWDSVTKKVSETFSTGQHRKFDSDVSSRIDKITPVSIQLNATNYEILMRFYNNEKVIGERILVVDFNYDNFDIKNSRSRSIKALGDLKHDFDITDMMFTMHYKYGSIHECGTEHDTSFDEEDIRFALFWTTFELINSTKKYQS